MRHRAREWAHQHAFFLIFTSIMFFITWVVEVLANVLL